RGDRVGADHEDESVASLDRPAQRGRKHLRVADALDVDPDVLAALPQTLDELVHELGVAARVGDEDVGQGSSSPWDEPTPDSGFPQAARRRYSRRDARSSRRTLRAPGLAWVDSRNVNEPFANTIVAVFVGEPVQGRLSTTTPRAPGIPRTPMACLVRSQT